MDRLFRWGVAVVCVAGFVLVLQEGRAGRLAVYWVFPPCALLGGIAGAMIAPDIAGGVAGFFIRGIMGGTAPAAKPPKRTHAVARALRMQGRYGEAIEEYQRVLEAEPDDIGAQRAIVDILLDKLEAYERGAKELTTLLAMELVPGERVAALNRLADLYEHHLGAPLGAAECLRRIPQQFPETAFARNAEERLARLAERHPEIGT